MRTASTARSGQVRRADRLCRAGKNWLDLVHALSLLGIDEAEAERLGLTTYKVGQTWPMDMNRSRNGPRTWN